MLSRRLSIVRAFIFVGLSALTAASLEAQSHITTPQEQFGHNFGDDYFLANYKQIADYWRKLDAESDRMLVQEIGKTAEGRPHLMAIVSSPENIRNLAKYKDISRRLALAEGLSDDDARALSKEGKTVVWIDGGLHATEVLGAQQLGQMVYEMVSRTDEETMRFLNDAIILFVHANPDGNDLVADWYMRNPDPLKRSTANLPRLYQKYIGHDNNREFFTSTQPETENINRVLYHEWFPQILYNHHQSGPAGTIFYSPPFRDPNNYNLDPILILGFQTLGAWMHTRMAVEGKPGATMRSGGPYDGWWNGGIRNTAAFHNVIAILTEMVGGPTPMRIPLVPSRQLPNADQIYPVAPQEWHFRQSIEYSMTANRAVLDYASRLRENLLWDRYVMGRNSIARGNTDTWTTNPKRIADVEARMGGNAGRGGRGGGDATGARDMAMWAELHKREMRDPRGFILPSDQPDFPRATTFINALRETGITVQRATSAFTVGGKQYPAGSYVVFAAQAFRPHVIDMFEPQVHPDVFPIPGGPPTPPYDNAGWTFAFQVGLQFDRILDGFTCPCEKITEWNIKPPAGAIANTQGAAGFFSSRVVNNAYIAMNRLEKAGEDVSTLTSPATVGTKTWPAGTFFVRAKGTTKKAIDAAATDLGVSFDGTRSVPNGLTKLKPVRVGLWDQYGGSMPAGWTRWILEQYEFPFERVFAPQLDGGNLNTKFDALVFVDGAIPGSGGTGRGGGAGSNEPPELLPAEYQGQFGRMSVEKTLPQLKTFIENGGTVVAIGSSAENLAAYLKLPIENHLSENGQPLPQSKFYTPGSVLSARFDLAQPLTYGMTEHTDIFFDNSPVFRLAPNATAAGVKKVAWFDSKAPLRSGWSWGQQYLENGVVAVEAQVGKGKVILLGPEITQRAQPHATFKLLFNAILESGVLTRM